MNVAENYNGDLERTNTHPVLLPQKMETLQDETIKILKKSGVASVSHKKENHQSSKGVGKQVSDLEGTTSSP